MTELIKRPLSKYEEASNTLSHGLGLALSILGFILLFSWNERPMSLTAKWSVGIFGLSLIALYLCSTLYHATRDDARKRFLKYCDHSAIYLLIAGTYTPFCLLGSGQTNTKSLVIAVWIMAAIGIIGKFYFVGRYRLISTLMYLLMGWLVLFQYEMLFTMPRGQLKFLVAGGLSYSLGTVFYMWRQLPFSHAIWHLFVLGGSVSHYLGVLFYIVAASG